MEQSRMDRKKTETRRKVVSAALLLMKDVGFDGVTMEQIADAADIAKGTLYSYFPVKEAILDEYIRQSFQIHADERLKRIRMLPDTRSRMKSILLELIDGIRSQPVLFERYFSYRIRQMISMKQEESQASGFGNLEGEIILLGQASGEIRTDLPVNLLMALFEFTFIEIAQQYYAAPDRFDAEKVSDQCVSIFLRGAGL